TDPAGFGAGDGLAAGRVLRGLEQQPRGPPTVQVEAAHVHLGGVLSVRPGDARHGGRLVREVAGLCTVDLDERDLDEGHVHQTGLAVGHGGIGQRRRRAEHGGADGDRGRGGGQQRAARDGGERGGGRGGGQGPRGRGDSAGA